jgi:hypothetical protein
MNINIGKPSKRNMGRESVTSSSRRLRTFEIAEKS